MGGVGMQVRRRMIARQIMRPSCSVSARSTRSAHEDGIDRHRNQVEGELGALAGHVVWGERRDAGEEAGRELHGDGAAGEDGLRDDDAADERRDDADDGAVVAPDRSDAALSVGTDQAQRYRRARMISTPNVEMIVRLGLRGGRREQVSAVQGAVNSARTTTICGVSVFSRPVTHGGQRPVAREQEEILADRARCLCARVSHVACETTYSRSADARAGARTTSRRCRPT